MSSAPRSLSRSQFPEGTRLTLLENDADAQDDRTDRLAAALDNLSATIADELEQTRSEVRKNGQRNLIFAVTVLSAILAGIVVALLAAHTIASAHP